jgi:hypothetical protein
MSEIVSIAKSDILLPENAAITLPHRPSMTNVAGTLLARRGLLLPGRIAIESDELHFVNRILLVEPHHEHRFILQTLLRQFDRAGLYELMPMGTFQEINDTLDIMQQRRQVPSWIVLNPEVVVSPNQLTRLVQILPAISQLRLTTVNDINANLLAILSDNRGNGQLWLKPFNTQAIVRDFLRTNLEHQQYVPALHSP